MSMPINLMEILNFKTSSTSFQSKMELGNLLQSLNRLQIANFLIKELISKIYPRITLSQILIKEQEKTCKMKSNYCMSHPQLVTFKEYLQQKHINNRLSNIKEMMKTSILLILMNTQISQSSLIQRQVHKEQNITIIKI